MFYSGTPVSGEGKLMHPDLVNRFYILNNQQLFWYAHNAESYKMRYTLQQMIDSSAADGLSKNKYHYDLYKVHSIIWFDKGDGVRRPYRYNC